MFGSFLAVPPFDDARRNTHILFMCVFAFHFIFPVRNIVTTHGLYPDHLWPDISLLFELHIVMLPSLRDRLEEPTYWYRFQHIFGMMTRSRFIFVSRYIMLVFFLFLASCSGAQGVVYAVTTAWYLFTFLGSFYLRLYTFCLLYYLLCVNKR